MSKERKAKRKTKAIYRTVRNLYNEISHNKGIFEELDKIDRAYKNLEEIKGCGCPDPNPLLALLLGVNERKSEAVKRKGIQNNRHILEIIIVDTVFRYLLNSSYEEVGPTGPTNQDSNPNLKFENYLELFLKQKDPRMARKKKVAGGFFRKLFGSNKEEIDSKKADERADVGAVLENLGLPKDKLKEYFTNNLINQYANFVNILTEINYETANEEISVGLLESFESAENSLKNLKRIGLEKQIYMKKGKQEKDLSLEDISKIALRYGEKELDIIEQNLPLASISFNKWFFQDSVQNHYNFLKKFIRKRSKEEYLEEKISKLDEIIEMKKKVFSEEIMKLQDTLYKNAKENAEKGSQEYKKFLEEFIKLSINYSQILEEEKGDIDVLFRVYKNPDLYISINEKNENNLLPLYVFYKKLSEASLVKAVLDVELAYLKALRENPGKIK